MMRDSRQFVPTREPMARGDQLFLLSMLAALALFWAMIGFWVIRQFVG